MDVVILCGGRGTRLSEETTKKPKPNYKSRHCMEYKVIVVDASQGIIDGCSIELAASSLAEQVNAQIHEGWEPHGSVNFCETANETPYLLQAMVKRAG